MVFGLSIQKLHKGNFIRDIIRIICEQKFLLTIVEHLLCTSACLMNQEEIGGLTFPWRWMVRILRFVDHDHVFFFLQLFNSFLGTCSGVVFIWVILFDHGWTIIAPFHRFEIRISWLLGLLLLWTSFLFLWLFFFFVLLRVLLGDLFLLLNLRLRTLFVFGLLLFLQSYFSSEFDVASLLVRDHIISLII